MSLFCLNCSNTTMPAEQTTDKGERDTEVALQMIMARTLENHLQKNTKSSQAAIVRGVFTNFIVCFFLYRPTWAAYVWRKERIESRATVALAGSRTYEERKWPTVTVLIIGPRRGRKQVCRKYCTCRGQVRVGWSKKHEKAARLLYFFLWFSFVR